MDIRNRRAVLRFRVRIGLFLDSVGLSASEFVVYFPSEVYSNAIMLSFLIF